MSNIDLSQIITADAKQSRLRARRTTLVKAECRRRIFAAASDTAQTNITAASSADLLDAQQKAAWVAALGWVQAMRAACLPLIEDPQADVTHDGAWPDLPEGVAELIEQF
ncbi:hypothetical protein [Falsiruegeria mediterranea]|uniref:hypothetical protein n=1 Tax=Falsiruegeria mediterranea TaxID=1280832 RepID=UPI0015F24F35|nr:hypothetical protein [Falsiruegeria mediterranea]